MKLLSPSSTIFLLYFSSLLLLITAAAPAPSPPDPSCSDELVRFSVCLPYIASSPNNLTDAPPRQCCDDFASSASSYHSLCLCYFVHQPLILGFPINDSRIFQIPNLCPTVDYTPRPNISLDSLCSGSPELPPLHSITGPDHGQEGSPAEQQSQVAGPPGDSNAPEASADSPTASPEDGREESLPEQQSTSAALPMNYPSGDFDDYIVPEPTADSLTEPNSKKPTSSRSSTTMSMKNRCRLVPLSFLLLYLHCYALNLA